MAGFFIIFRLSMKKVLLLLALVVLIGIAVVGWMLAGPATGFAEQKETLYIRTSAANRAAILDSLVTNRIIKNQTAFNWLANRMGYWNSIKPGKYEFAKGSSLLSIVRKLRNGQQTPVNLVITKLRTKEDLARLVGRRLESDSAGMMAYLHSSALQKEHNIAPEAAMALVLPDTYTFLWNTTPEKVYQKLSAESEKFWNAERRQKATALGLTPLTAYILASIVEEESNKLEEKDTIASVYINRIRVGMPLQADPTVKFALKDFALTRIYGDHLDVASPYNTYRNRGLPPGPICTPSKKTIDAVLAAPPTDYIYFVANPALNGTHVFSNSYAEHMLKARAYQQAYKVWLAARNEKRGLR